MFKFVEFKGNNMIIDMKNKLAFQLYCGRSYFIMCVVDRKNTNTDPVPWNNYKAVPTKLNCPEGS